MPKIRVAHHTYAELKGNGQQARVMYLQETYKGFIHVKQDKEKASLGHLELKTNYIKKFIVLM